MDFPQQRHSCHVWTTHQVPRRYLVGLYCKHFFVFFPNGMLLMLLLLSGGGVGGLSLAFALSRSPDIQVDIYEAASKFTEIGAGILVWRRTKQILASLGLEEDIIRLLPFHPGEDQSKPGRYGCMRLLLSLQSRPCIIGSLISPVATPWQRPVLEV